MPVSDNVRLFAMYVIGEVESNWNWAAVNYSDPITLGMMQWYGTRAGGLLERCKAADPDYWETFSSAAPRLAGYVDSSYTGWTSVYVTAAEGEAWGAWAERDANHEAQQLLWYDDFDDYVTTLTGWGIPESNTKQLVFAMCMYHQSPARCGNVISSCGGSATLQLMYTTCLNDSVLGQYRNRYTTCYNRLNDWDGESAPPDFGQADVDSGTGDSAQIETQAATFSYITQQDGLLYVHGIEGYSNGVICYPSGPKLWRPAYAVGQTEITGGNTGGGSATGSEAQQQLAQWMIDHEGAYDYSQGAGRLSPDTSGYTDCSGCVWYCYQQVCGIEIGTWTGAQLGYGTLIAEGSGDAPISDMLPGDLCLVAWSGYGTSAVGHVEMYIGDNRLSGHGGPGKGPYVKDDALSYLNRTSYWNIRRYVE